MGENKLSYKNNYTFKIVLVLIILLQTSFIAFGQGRIPKSKNKFLGALEFLPEGKLAEGFNRIKMAIPNEKDPMIDPKKWYTSGDFQMRGFVDDAVLFFEWALTESCPLERYKFDWTSSGYFELINNKEGQTNITRISRSDLAKYPNLLKRFDGIAPHEIVFEFTFSTGNISDKEYYAFRNKYNIMEDLGSAGYSVNYTRQLNADFILYKTSRNKHDWVYFNPIAGGWDKFLNMPDKYEDKKSKLIELFKLGRDLKISSFKIKSINWNISDFTTIAEKYKNYESGKEKPTAFDEVERGEKENKAGDGFWDETDITDSETEPFYDSKIRKYGIRTKKGKVIKSPIYDRIEKSPKESYFIAQDKNTVFILNNSGKELYSKNYSRSPNIGACKNGKLYASIQTSNEKVGDYNYYIQTYENDYFRLGKYHQTSKIYNSYEPASLTVVSGSDTRTREEREADERSWKKERSALINQKVSSLKSMGYVEGNNDCN